MKDFIKDVFLNFKVYEFNTKLIISKESLIWSHCLSSQSKFNAIKFFPPHPHAIIHAQPYPPSTRNILNCNLGLGLDVDLISRPRETGTWTADRGGRAGYSSSILVDSAWFRTNYNSFWFSVSLQMQKCKMASRPLSRCLRMLWYGMGWPGMGCLSVDRWSLCPPMIKFCVSFEAYMRKCLWSPRFLVLPSPWFPRNPPSRSSCIHRSGPMHLNLSGRQPNRSTTNQPQSPVRSAIMPVSQCAYTEEMLLKKFKRSKKRSYNLFHIHSI